jgi:hypothetical protein
VIGVIRFDLNFDNELGLSILLPEGTLVRMVRPNDVNCCYWRERISQLQSMGCTPVPFRVIHDNKTYTLIGTPESVKMKTGGNFIKRRR